MLSITFLEKIFLALLLELGLISSCCLPAVSQSAQKEMPVFRMTGEMQFLLAQSYSIGDRVEVWWEGEWYPAKIFDRQAGSYCITYVGYDRSWDECVESDRIRYPERPFGNINPRRGETVEVFWEGDWYPAIVEDIQRGTYCITYVGYDRSWDECVESDRIRN